MAFVCQTLNDNLLPEEKKILQIWKMFVDKIEENDWDFLSTRLDWAIKKNLMERKLERQGISPYLLTDGTIFFETAKWHLQAIDLFYHDISEEGIYNQLSACDKITQLLDNHKINEARTLPPNTRANWRGKTVSYLFSRQKKELLSDIEVYPFWDKITFDCNGYSDKKYIFQNPDPWETDWSDIKQFIDCTA